MAANFVNYIDQKPEVNLTDIAFSLNTGRFHHKQRLTLLVSNTASFKEQLRAFVNGNDGEANIIYGEVRVNTKIAFVCNDARTIFPAMGKELFVNEPVFRDALMQCDRLFQNYLNFSIKDLLDNNQDINDPLYVHPTLFAPK